MSISKYIDLGNNKRVTNPCYNPKTGYVTWEGDVNEFDFGGEGLEQMSNYNIIRDSLEEFGIKFDKVWSVTISTPTSPLVKYIVSCKDINIFWYKYESSQHGGAQNNIIVNGCKIKTSTWKKMSKDERLTKLKENGIVLEEPSSITLESA